MMLLLLTFFTTVSSLRVIQLSELHEKLNQKWLNADPRNIIQSIRLAMAGNSKTLGALNMEPDGEVFCFAFTRSPADPTAEMLANQLDKGCDGYALFSNEAFTLGKHKVIQAFSDNERKTAMNHHMHDMIIGAWKQMAEMGVLGKYRWYVKFDTDSFVQPSVVRKTFSRYSREVKDTIISTGWSSGTIFDGFLVGIPNTLLKKAYAFYMRENVGDKVRVCDEFFTGHFYRKLPETNYESCSEEVGMFSVLPPQDENQNLLLVLNQEEHLQDPAFSGCNHIAEKVLAHFQTQSEPLCSCIPSDSQRGKQCYPRGFMSIHPVKDPVAYKEFVRMFP